MAAPTSPTVARWELSLRLRQRRHELGMDVKTITDHLGFSRNYWSAVENERAVLAEDKLEAVLDLFDFNETERAELLRLRQAARDRGWWSGYSALLNEDLVQLYGLEFGASRIETYEVLIVTGLLQTEEYARTLITTNPAVRPLDRDQLVDIRLRRQARLEGENALELQAVMSEAALMQQVGGPGVLRRQLQHLLDQSISSAGRINIRILPFTAPPGGVTGASTVYLLAFDSPHLPTIAWQESMTQIGIIEDVDTVRHLRLSYGQALEASLSAEESLDLIQKRVEELADYE